MSKPNQEFCPHCDEEVKAADINIQEGVLLCSGCHQLSRLSELNFSGLSADEVLSEIPNDIKVLSDQDKLEVHLSLRSPTDFIVSLAFSLFWNGLLFVFVLLAISGIYYNIMGPLPDWAPVPGLEKGVPIMNNEPMGVGITIFVCLFLTQFIVIGMGGVYYALIRWFGVTKIVINRNASYVSTGFFIFHFKKNFDVAKVSSIKSICRKSNEDNQKSYEIEISASNKLKFGSLLTDYQKIWTLAFLKAILIQKRKLKNISKPFWL